MTQEQIRSLQDTLVSAIIEYINTNGIKDLQEVSFTADELQRSAMYGKWCPDTDSFIQCVGYKWEDDKPHLPERYVIGEYM